MEGSFQQLGKHPLLGLLIVPWNCPLGVLLSLQIEDQGLVEFDLSAILDPSYFNQFMLCPWAMSFFKSCAPPPSLLFHALFLSPFQAHSVASTIWRDNQKIAGPWEGNTVIPNSSRYSGEGNGTPLQYSCLENPMDGGAW